MKSGLNSLQLVFIVNEQNTLETLCKHIQRMGFTVKEASSPEDIKKFITDKSFPFNHISTAKMTGDIHIELIHMLSSVSSNTTSIVIALHDLSLIKICQNPQHLSLHNHLTLSEVEREYIVATLKKCGWRCKKAAKLLGINRTTLYRKMKKYGITRKK